MPARNELATRARAVGFDPSTIANDSKLEQKVLWLEKRASARTGTAASSTLTSTGVNVSDNDTVTIGDNTYTFKTTLGTAANQVLIGATAAISLDNLKAAATRTGTPGTDYTSATKINPDVDATTNTDTTQLFVARDTNTGADLATTDTAATLSWTGATLSAGTAGAAGVVAGTNSTVTGGAGLSGDRNTSL